MPKIVTQRSLHSSPRKRARIRCPGVKSPSQQGRLMKIVDLPLELVIMIFCYLLPADLLAIFDTADGSIVRFLTSHVAEVIWRVVRANATGIQVPPRPSNTTEWEYTSLLFKNRCTTCDRQCRTVEFDCLVRCCNYCRENPALYKYVDHSESGLDFTESFLPMIYASDTSFYVPISHWNSFHARLRSVQALPCPVDKTKQMKDYCSELKTKQMERYQMNKALSTWWAACGREKVVKRAAIRARRTSTIVEKISNMTVLRERFFALSDKERYDFYNLAIMKRTQDISDHDWTKVLNTVGEFFQQLTLAQRYRSILLQLSHIYIDFIRTQADPQLLPDFADICSFFSINQAIDAHAHSGTRWCSSAVEGLHEYLPTQIFHWRNAALRTLLAKIPNHIKFASPAHPAYNLATVWFEARSDAYRFRGRIVQFPQVLRVRFVPEKERKFDDGWSPAVHRYNALTAWPHPVPWLEAEEEIVFSSEAAECAREVVRKVGLDPATTLQADMDALNPRLVCTCMFPGYIRNWRSMVEHKYSCSEGTLIVLNADDTRRIVQIEKEEFDRTCLARRFYCTRCDAFQHAAEATLLGMDEHRQHCAERHDTDKLSFSWEHRSTWPRIDSDTGLRSLPYGKSRPRVGYLTTSGLVGCKINRSR